MHRNCKQSQIVKCRGLPNVNVYKGIFNVLTQLESFHTSCLRGNSHDAYLLLILIECLNKKCTTIRPSMNNKCMACDEAMRVKSPAFRTVRASLRYPDTALAQRNAFARRLCNPSCIVASHYRKGFSEVTNSFFRSGSIIAY